MNLQQLIERYVNFRQSLGENCRGRGSILRAFGRAVGADAGITDVSAEQVSAFLAGKGPLSRAWFDRHNALLGFYRYAISRGHVSQSPLPAVLPKRPPSCPPYIYSQEELRRLLQAADSYQRQRSDTEPVTMRTVVLLLYATGLRSGEAVALDRTDVNLGDSLIVVRQGKFSKNRLVPFGPQLGSALTQYSASRPVQAAAPDVVTPFFTTRTGTRVTQNTMEHSFRRMCAQAGIRRSGGARCQPRLHDLRHTFAVHRLTTWYRQGADVQKLLPQLSVYLGHTHLACTQVYLTMTPDLLGEANARFEGYAGKEGNHA